MEILHTPLSECVEALRGKPYRIADFSITRHALGFECTADRLYGMSFLLPPNVTLIDVRRYVTVFNAGYAAGVNSERRAHFDQTQQRSREKEIVR